MVGTENRRPEKWMALPLKDFKAKWKSSPADAKHWTVENGELVNDGKGPFLSTLKNYADFELMLEYRTVAGADSGIYWR